MRYAILVIIILLAGCVSTKPMDETIYTTGYDFSKYTEQGFLFTPEQYLDDYESIGLITVTLWPDVQQFDRYEQAGSNSYTTKEWQVGRLNVSKAIDEIYQQASDMGADAITRFHINSTEMLNGEIMVPGAEISGFAIKRVNPQATN